VIILRDPTVPSWTQAVLADFDAFLLDHAACERKASATGMLFVVRYPDRGEILDSLIRYAREELEHFHEVYRRIAERGLTLAADTPDPYASRLLQSVRHGRDERFLDRLLVAGILEARGCERFGRLASALPEGPLQEFYRDLTRADARHQRLFVDLAHVYFDPAAVEARLVELLDVESDLIRDLPVRAALYA
jgi:tRNA-(ms[2]io[6]A)-hydroxylase